MSKFEVKVRNMQTGEALVATLDSYEDAVTFLSERPPFMEVLGVLSDVSVVQMEQLKNSMRPYNGAEQELKKQYDAKKAAAAQKAYEDELGRLSEMEDADKQENASADPDRPLSVRWEIDEGMTVVDANDHREITAEARKAIEVWVAERNTWVEERGQFVAEAHLQVYPREVPGGDEAERVVRGGTFVPRLKN